MSSSKTINYSAPLFKVKNRKSAGKSSRKHQKTQSNKINKDKLINRLKQHMSTQKINPKLDESLSNFDKHLSYFQKLNKEKRKTRSRNKKENVFTNLPLDMVSKPIESVKTDEALLYSIKPAPEYGILKGAKKPTMREWKRSTQKNVYNATTDMIPPIAAPPISNIICTTDMIPPIAAPPISNIICTTDMIPPIAAPPISNMISPIAAPPISNIICTTDMIPPIAAPPIAPPIAPPPISKPHLLPNQKTYLLGKRSNKIGVLIKNNNTRKRIKKEIDILNTAPIYEVKEYLKKHQLYKAGNNTPQDILREIYKSAHLAGKPVKNTSVENLLHNFYKL